MYFSMIDDLPTDWSPRKMILYLVRPPPTVLDDTLIPIIELLRHTIRNIHYTFSRSAFWALAMYVCMIATFR